MYLLIYNLLMAINSSTTRLGQRWAIHWLSVKIWQKLQKKIIQCMFFFYKYNKNSIKSQERERRTQRVIYPDYKLSINTTLQARNTIMKNSNTKRQLINIICTHSESQNTHIIGEEQTMFQHEEVDVCIISYLFHLIRLY